jgi:hypothetical protein
VAVEDQPAGGDDACWLGRVCERCGRIPDDGEVDADGRCPACRTAADPAGGDVTRR